ncbi:hypothetical protein HK102_004110, partial [Quaeritorhiza haematococci]
MHFKSKLRIGTLAAAVLCLGTSQITPVAATSSLSLTSSSISDLFFRPLSNFGLVPSTFNLFKRTTPQAPEPTTDALLCDPERLVLEDVVDGSNHKFQCRLKNEPKGPVKVYFEAQGLKFDVCFIEFTPQNWNIPKPVRVTVVPALLDAQQGERDIAIKAKFSAPTEPYDRHVFQQPCRRICRKAAECIVRGDPHFVDINRNKWDFHGEGTYTLVQSSGCGSALMIQAKYAKCTKSASCTVGLAVITPQCTMIINLHRATAAAPTLEAMNGCKTDGIKYETDEKRIRIEIADGTKVEIVLGEWKPAKGDTVYFLANTIRLPACHYGRTFGQCGAWDDNDKKDVLYCKEQQWPLKTGGDINQGNVDAYSKCWATPPEQDVFAGRPCNLPAVPGALDYVPLTCTIPSDFEQPQVPTPIVCP